MIDKNQTFNGVDGVLNSADATYGQRTFIIQLGGNLVAKYNGCCVTPIVKQASTKIAAITPVHCISLKDSIGVVIPSPLLSQQIQIAQETFSQVGVKIFCRYSTNEYSTLPDPLNFGNSPANTNLFNMSNELRLLLFRNGKLGGAHDICLLYIRGLCLSFGEVISDARGVSMMQSGFLDDVSLYTYNALIAAGSRDDKYPPAGPFTIAHELVHLLSRDPDHLRISGNLMAGSSRTNNDIANSKRLTEVQEAKIISNSHAIKRRLQ